MHLVVRQISGLGNQLFQYAAGRYYSKRYNAEMSVATDPEKRATSHGHPRPFLLSHFAITAPVKELTTWELLMLARRKTLRPVAATLQSLLHTQVFFESKLYTFLEDIPLRGNVETLYIAGYWQSHRLVDAVADDLRSEFRFKEPARGKNLEMLGQIKQCESAVSLHVRRGDYTLAAEGNIALPIDYYLQAIALCKERLSEPTFFVFSDDIAYTKANLPADLRAVFVDHNDAVTSHEDLRLMSSCQHHIIANSTFSWWGAWLNSRTDKMVFAPKYWHLKKESYYPELFPTDWTLIEV